MTLITYNIDNPIQNDQFEPSHLFHSIQVITLQPYLMLFPKYALFMDVINYW
jgi:hypothetical protein